MSDIDTSSRSKWLIPIVVLGMGALALAFILSRHPVAGSPTTDRLTVYCAAGLKSAVEEISRQYAQERHVEIDLRYGGSGELLSSFAVSHVGDVFIAADSKYIDDTEKKGLGADRSAIAEQQPILAVASGNPKHIHGLADVDRPDVKFGLANPETAAIGRLAKRVLSDNKQWDDFAAHCAVMKPTVSDIALDLSLGALDARADPSGRRPSRSSRASNASPEPILDNTHDTVSACVLADSRQPVAALAFCRYLAAPDCGGKVFASHGYTPVSGAAGQIGAGGASSSP